MTDSQFLVPLALLLSTIVVVIASIEEPTASGRRLSAKAQRPRESRPEDPDDFVDEFGVRKAYARVPEIGNGFRWYDSPYLALNAILYGPLRSLIPYRARGAISRLQAMLLPFNEHERNQLWPDGSRRQIDVPLSEDVTTAGIWVLELFPPSALRNFEDAIGRQGWHQARWWDHAGDSNLEKLERSRSRDGTSWWRVADLVSKKTRWWSPDGIRTSMPDSFDHVELRAVQVGASLTAVIARFRLTKDAQSGLNKVWHRDHQPVLLKQGRRRRALDQEWSAYWRTQSERRRLHDECRSWLTEKIPGYFAEKGQAPPLLDLLLFRHFDPIESVEDTVDDAPATLGPDALRALGLGGFDHWHRTSTALPGLRLTPLESGLHEAMGDAPTWTLWGKRARVRDELGERATDGFQGSIDSAITHRVESMYNLFVMLGVNELSERAAKDLADIRDHAAVMHGKFKAKSVNHLRSAILSVSLDISSVYRDVQSFWNLPWRGDWDAQFIMRLAPRLQRVDREIGREPEPDQDFNKLVRERQSSRLSQLQVSDRDYREILSAVATLGSTIDSSRIGRLALIVALASLVLAIVPILLASYVDDSVLSAIVRKAASLWEALR